MPGTLRIILLGLIVGSTAVPATTFAASANDEPIAATAQIEPTIVLHVVNLAAISREVLDQIKEHVARVYDGAGVRTVWIDSEDAVERHLDGGLHLTVMLLPRAIGGRKISMERFSHDALGRAHPAIGRAYIFCDRVASMPGPKFFAIQLGAVIAHEVGHLVLPEKGHSRHGIMRAEMDVRHAIHLPIFDETQGDQIRAMLMKSLTAAPGR
jgi:hypothetical protein